MTHHTQPTPSEAKSDIQGIGCLLIFMGIVGAIFGMAGLFGIINNLELIFFGIDLNSQHERVYWIIGSFASICIGILLIRIKSKQPNKSL
jgi:hypothetical protein